MKFQSKVQKKYPKSSLVKDPNGYYIKVPELECAPAKECLFPPTQNEEKAWEYCDKAIPILKRLQTEEEDNVY